MFEQWLSSKDIEVLKVEDFEYSDADFPDIMHLSLNRRDEFSALLFSALQNSALAEP